MSSGEGNAFRNCTIEYISTSIHFLKYLMSIWSWPLLRSSCLVARCQLLPSGFRLAWNQGFVGTSQCNTRSTRSRPWCLVRVSVVSWDSWKEVMFPQGMLSSTGSLPLLGQLSSLTQPSKIQTHQNSDCFCPSLFSFCFAVLNALIFLHVNEICTCFRL